MISLPVQYWKFLIQSFLEEWVERVLFTEGRMASMSADHVTYYRFTFREAQNGGEMELDLSKLNELLKKARVKRGYMTVRRIGEGKEEEEIEVRITGDQCLTTTFKYKRDVRSSFNPNVSQLKFTDEFRVGAEALARACEGLKDCDIMFLYVGSKLFVGGRLFESQLRFTTIPNVAGNGSLSAFEPSRLCRFLKRISEFSNVLTVRLKTDGPIYIRAPTPYLDVEFMQAPRAIASIDVKLLKEVLIQEGEAQAIPVLEKLMEAPQSG